MTNRTYSLQQVNAMNKQEFIYAFGAIVEHSRWVAQAAWEEQPFATISAIARSMQQAIYHADDSKQLAILNAHPDLSGKEAEQGKLTDFSNSEQSRIGVNQLSKEDFAKVRAFNQQYRECYGFPFILCLASVRDLAHLFKLQQQRCKREQRTEMKEAIDQVCQIAAARISKVVEDT